MFFSCCCGGVTEREKFNHLQLTALRIQINTNRLSGFWLNCLSEMHEIFIKMISYYKIISACAICFLQLSICLSFSFTANTVHTGPPAFSVSGN